MHPRPIADTAGRYQIADVPAGQIVVRARFIGYSDATRTLYIKFRDGTTLRFEKVPRFRYQGLLAAPRKDAYHKTFIKDQFLTKPT